MRRLDLPPELVARIAGLPEEIVAPEAMGRIAEVGAALEVTRSEARKTLTEAQAIRDAARAEGLAEGRAEGIRQAMSRLDGHHGRLDTLRAEVETKVSALAHEVLEAVLGVVPEARLIALAARQAVRQSGVTGRVRLVAHPAVAEGAGAALRYRLGVDVELEVARDANLAPNAAWIDTALGRIDLGGLVQDRAIREALGLPADGAPSASPSPKAGSRRDAVSVSPASGNADGTAQLGEASRAGRTTSHREESLPGAPPASPSSGAEEPAPAVKPSGAAAASRPVLPSNDRPARRDTTRRVEGDAATSGAQPRTDRSARAAAPVRRRGVPGNTSAARSSHGLGKPVDRPAKPPSRVEQADPRTSLDRAKPAASQPSREKPPTTPASKTERPDPDTPRLTQRNLTPGPVRPPNSAARAAGSLPPPVSTPSEGGAG